MATVSLVADVKKLAKVLGGVVRASPKPTRAELNPANKDRASKLLELKALYSLLKALHGDGWKIAVERKGSRIHFLGAPGKKSSASHFVIEKAKEKYQVVHGSQVRDRYGAPRAPDISLQAGCATEDPDYNDVLAIWDAKLHGSTGAPTDDPVSDDDFARFLKVMDWLAVPDVAASAKPLSNFPAAFEVSGLITNGRRPTENDKLFIGEGVSIAERFESETTAMRPTRAVHLAARRKR